MLRCCRAKYAQHADLRRDLVATGDAPLNGAPSTCWRSGATGDTHTWTAWNGRIQALCRAELRGEAAAAAEGAAVFASHLAREGGATRALPEDGAAPLAPEPAAAAADTVEADVAAANAAAANAAGDAAPDATRRDDAASPKHADAALADETARCSLGETLPPPPPAPHA